MESRRADFFSTLPLETLLSFKNECNLHLCQEFIYYNPARLPGPIEWVNKQRIRVKDSFTQIWWMSKTPYPYANNRNVAEPYSRQMKKLLASGKYNSGTRPSEHIISETAFSIDNGGAIPSNVIIAANTTSNDIYIKNAKNITCQFIRQEWHQLYLNFFINFFDATRRYCARLFCRK